MGLVDFDVMFNMLDPGGRGYITLAQLKDFDETLHFNKLCDAQVDEAMLDICGVDHKDCIQRNQFAMILQELQRRRVLEERVRWDFMALDRTGNHRISVSDTLMLFKMTHGDDFSINTWNQFINSRDDSVADVYFDEVRLWLCSRPSSSVSETTDVHTEAVRLQQLKQQEVEEEFIQITQYQADDQSMALQKQDYQDNTRRLARRKKYIWEKEGIEALLHDDGVDRGEDIPTRMRPNVSVNDILDALDYKYKMLRKKLLWDMLRKQYGEQTWSAMSHTEQYDAYEQLHLEEKQLRNTGELTKNGAGLIGAKSQQIAPVDVLMGELPDDWKTENALLNPKIQKMKTEGKSEDQIKIHLQQEFGKTYIASTSHRCLVALNERHQNERDYYLNQSQSEAKQQITFVEIIMVLCQLLRQQAEGETEDNFTAVATAVGLAERPQQYKSTGFDPDRYRNDLLAQKRLEQRKSHRSQVFDSREVYAGKKPSLTDLQITAVKEITLKHQLEREILIEMLQGKEAVSYKTKAGQMNYEGRQNKLASLRNLRNNWRESMDSERIENRAQHKGILQEAVGLHWVDEQEKMKKSQHRTTDSDVDTSILADLQQMQDQDFNSLLSAIMKKSEKEVNVMRKTQYHARAEELLDNIAAVVLGTVTWSDEEKPIIDALEAKYEALRQLCLKNILTMEYGTTWHMLSEAEKDKLLIKKRVDEKKLRQEGKMNEIKELVKPLSQEIFSLRTLIGEDRKEYWKRIAIKSAKDQTMIENNQTSHVFNETTPADDGNNNLLSDLLPRQQAEQDALIGELRSVISKGTNEQESMLLLVLVRFEKWLTSRAEGFQDGPLSVGLFERVSEALQCRHPHDQERQKKLAMCRADLRRKRLDLGEPYHKEYDSTRPPKGSLVGWMEALLHEVEKKHASERELFLELLQEPDMEDLRMAASTMTQEERTNRLLELRNHRNTLNLEITGDQDENICILEEASAIRTEQTRAQRSDQGDVSMETITVLLLAELQDEQDREMAKIIAHLPQMTEEELKINREYHITSRHQGAALHAIAVFTRYTGRAQEEEIIKALEEKYDAMKDKLFLEALIRQVGEKLSKLTEQERQKLLLEMKLKARKLKREGKEDELRRLLGEGEENDARLRKLLGDSRAEYQRKLNERLKNRKQGNQGDGDDNEEEDEQPEATDPLSSLDDRFEKEKEALMAKLHGANTQFLSERERQLELIRLKRERRKAEHQGRFDEVANIMGLAERQQADLTVRSQTDKDRQEVLAKQRLEELRKRKAMKPKMVKENSVVTEGDRMVLQDILMLRLDERQDAERHLLVTLLGKEMSADLQQKLAACSESERQEQRKQLHGQYDNIPKEKVEACVSMLQEACHSCSESMRQTLQEDTEGATVERRDVEVALLADLQERQDQEAERYLQDMAVMDEEKLIETQKTILDEKQYQRGCNILALLFGQGYSRKEPEQQVVDALKAKYDVLREKVLLEALINQVGEKEWTDMTERERQQRLAELKLQERKLRKEGNLHDASSLLGECIRDHETLENLIGGSRAAYEKKLQRKLDQRKQRLTEGFTEEECDILEKEEEAESRKTRNVLLDLQHNFDNERDRLLRKLAEQKDRLAAEKDRQKLLAELRRQKQLAQREDQYEAAALAMNLGEKHAQTLEENRKKQEELAKERLTAELKRRRGQGEKPQSKKNEKNSGIENVNDPLDMVAAITQEMDYKHEQERDLLIELLQDPLLSKNLQTTSEKTVEERNYLMEGLLSRHEIWHSHANLDAQEQREILQEAISLKLLEFRRNFEKEGTPSTECDLQVALLANLQEVQDNETNQCLVDADDKSIDYLQKLYKSQLYAREQQWNDNIFNVVLGYSDSGKVEGDEAVLQALEQKYDAIRDKLFTEALMKQHGEAEWQRMTEQERQNQLLKLCLHERHLRDEGNITEASALLGDLQEREAELVRKLGDSQNTQKHKVAERLKRRQELAAERTEKGLSTDEAVLDAIMDQEDSQTQGDGVNLLQQLNNHFDEEKEALMKQLHEQNDRKVAERQRQIELLRLKRQKKQLSLEDKFDSAAVVLSLGEQHKKTHQTNMLNEHQRQKRLAKERLEQLRAKKQTTVQKENKQSKLEAKLKEYVKRFEADLAIITLKANQNGGDGNGVADAVLSTMEEKHAQEREILSQLILAADDPASVSEPTKIARNLGNEDMKAQLEKLRQEQSRWRQRSQQSADKYWGSGGLIEVEKNQHISDVAKDRVEQSQQMTQALILKITAEKNTQRAMSEANSEEASIEAVLTTMMADLQQKQDAETRAMEKLLVEQDSSVAEKLHSAQQMSLVEGWLDNLTAVLYSLKTGTKRENPDGASLEQKSQILVAELEEEFKAERLQLQEQLQAGVDQGEEVNIEEEMAKLASAQETRKKALLESLEKYECLEVDKQEAMQQADKNEEYEEDALQELLKTLESEVTVDTEVDEKEGSSTELMHQRIAARRERRRQERSADMSRRRSMSSTASSSTHHTEISADAPLSREKTVIDVAMSDDQKNELYMQLMRQHTAVNKKLVTEHKRREEQLKQRLEEMKNKRSSEASELLQMAERQKTTLMKHRSDEQKRQMAATKEHLARIRYEKTQTMRERSHVNTRKFDEFLSETEASGLTEDEKMQAVARKIEDKFKQDEASTSQAESGKKLTAEDKMQLLKQRRENKKKSRQNSDKTE